LGLHEIKNFYTTEKMVYKLKRPPTQWEKNLYQLYIRQGTDNQNIQGVQETKLPKNQCPSEEMG
jgi:hypothetical protein